MPKFQPADIDTKDLANEILFKFAGAHDKTYQEIIDARLRLDILFAYGDRDADTNDLLSPAIQKDGYPVLGQASIINLKNRAAGRGDVEILLDGDYWETAGDGKRAALLDHEIFHIAFKRYKDGTIQRDDLGRPLVKMRKHDVQVGWFATIAARHGDFSQERIQAAQVLDEHGQALFGDLLEVAKGLRASVKKFHETMKKAGATVEIKSGDESVKLGADA